MLNKKAMFSLSYGLYVLTAKEDDFNNGCIINTVMQITDEPKQIVIAVNKNNKTHDMIVSTGKFNISVISEKADFSLFERFGFQSGKNTDKFQGFDNISVSDNGIIYITEATNAFLSAEVTTMADCGTHTLFTAKVIDGEILNEDKSATYSFYFENIKPKQQKSTDKKGFVCKICGYVYEGEELPEDFICPLCKHGADDFEEIK